MLYWYALQNLGMGTYTLHAIGEGGMVLSGSAIAVIVIPKNKRVIVITTLSRRDAMLAQYSDYINTLAKLDGITPLPDPPEGVKVVQTSFTNERGRLAALSRVNKLLASIEEKQTELANRGHH